MGRCSLKRQPGILKAQPPESVYRMLAKVRKGGRGSPSREPGTGGPRRVRRGSGRSDRLALGKYRATYDTHLCEIPEQSGKGFVMGRETPSGYPQEEGILPAKGQTPPSTAPPRAQGGLRNGCPARCLPHDWLQGRGAMAGLWVGQQGRCLRVTYGPSRGRNHWGYWILMGEVISTHGVPLSLYARPPFHLHTPRAHPIIEQLKDVVPS